MRRHRVCETTVRTVLQCVLVAVLLGGAASCREEPPAERFNRNLGTAESPLLPTPAPTLDASLLDRAGGIESLADVADLGQPESVDDSRQEDRRKIAELIEAVRAANDDKDYEKLADLLVERQRDIMKASADTMREAATVAEAFIAAVESADPRPAFAAQILPMLRADLEFHVSIDDVMFDSESEASAPMPTGRIGFEKSGDAWFLVTNELGATADVQTRRTNVVLETLRDATRILDDASLTTVDRDIQIGAAFQEMAVAILSAPENPDGD